MPYTKSRGLMDWIVMNSIKRFEGLVTGIQCFSPSKLLQALYLLRLLWLTLCLRFYSMINLKNDIRCVVFLDLALFVVFWVR